MAGTMVVTTHDTVGDIRRAVIRCTADASDATFPAKSLSSLGLGEVSGALLILATNPGSPAPTDNYDISLVDPDSLDRLGGSGANRDTATTERTALSGVFVVQGEDLTLTITGNLVNSAVTDVALIYAPRATVGSGSGSGGGGGDASASNQTSEIALLSTIDADTSIINTNSVALGSAVGTEDSVPGATPKGIRVLGKRVDTLTTLTPAAGDEAQLLLNADGALQVIDTYAKLPSTDGFYIGANASGGASAYGFLDLDEGAAEVVKGSAGKLQGLIATNLHSATVFIKLWNRTSATAGTNNADYAIAIPAGSGLALDFGAGIDFTTGICIAATLGVANNDNTAIPSGNLVVGIALYK